MKESRYIFNGIYEIPEAASYLSHTKPFLFSKDISQQKLRYWIRTSIPTIHPPELPVQRHLVSFNDLISMRMVAIMRARGVKLSDIRRAEKYLRKQFGIEYPFITREVWTHGSDVFIKLEDFLLSASKYGQQAMDFLTNWITKVELDMNFGEDGLVISWNPYFDIVLDPRIQIGMPCLLGTRIPSRSIYRKLLAGDSPEIIASLYDISLSQIQNITDWERLLENNNGKITISS